MADKKRFLRLESIASFLQTESDGDEIFIKYKKKKVAPADGKFIKISKDPVPLGIEIELDKNEKWVELELWDYDRFSLNDSLGKFKLLVDQTSDNFTAELERTKDSVARYVLNWSVIDRINPRRKAARTSK